MVLLNTHATFLQQAKHAEVIEFGAAQRSAAAAAAAAAAATSSGAEMTDKQQREEQQSTVAAAVAETNNNGEGGSKGIASLIFRPPSGNKSVFLWVGRPSIYPAIPYFPITTCSGKK